MGDAGMSRVFMWLLPLLCLVMRIGAHVSPADTPIDSKDNGSLIADIAAEFRGLRTVKGHFEGGAWNAEVDKWMGRKHRVMIQLQSRLSAGRYNRAQLVEWLGPPDRIDPADDAGFDSIMRLPAIKIPADGLYELLIYYWRGPHDFLYFVSRENSIVDSGWWYAGD